MIRFLNLGDDFPNTAVPILPGFVFSSDKNIISSSRCGRSLVEEFAQSNFALHKRIGRKYVTVILTCDGESAIGTSVLR